MLCVKGNCRVGEFSSDCSGGNGRDQGGEHCVGCAEESGASLRRKVAHEALSVAAARASRGGNGPMNCNELTPYPEIVLFY